jgi:hypothetical protein
MGDNGCTQLERKMNEEELKIVEAVRRELDSADDFSHGDILISRQNLRLLLNLATRTHD